ncbi:MAG: hypothetical protein FE78DRAFT_142091 [Acidomyces sp. 'richmondensis']|uniref:ABM domain-containing protein n=1 Tax=Sulfobacillus thermosulfidooxidans TaxID=28034 RepID=A0A2T2WT52_SULTH|nr:MAG: hypothetical protein FE78DRAFT_142091 [Acidomyces sp. 'richmondensis']PSR25421.1 MAG: hypothetical protein C7B47_12255 [Sulfobacillus thermosulfidooxidans]
MNEFARTPKPPYYAVIFTSKRTNGDNGYELMAEEMVRLAEHQPGFLGLESVRNPDGFGITVSYWTSEEAICQWKDHTRHELARRVGREVWYEDFFVRVSKVERAYRFEQALP